MNQHALSFLASDHMDMLCGMFMEEILQKREAGVMGIASGYQKRTLFNKIFEALASLVNLGCVAHACG